MRPITPFARHRLPSGAPVRLRLPHRRDAHALVDLCERVGCGAPPFEVIRTVMRFDPRERTVIVATTWNGAFEELVGLAAIDLYPGAEPEVIAADPTLGDELPALLHETLIAHASRAA